MPALHDATFKRWFDHPQMVRDLLRGFAPADVAGSLDFDTLEQLSAQYVGDDMRQSRGDAAWRVRFRGREGDEWLYLVVLLEFQSTIDPHMAVRVFAYVGQLFLKLLRDGEWPRSRELPPVLPVVIYNGRSRWTAPRDVGETVAAVSAGLAPFQPRQRYLLLDEHALRVEDLPVENAVSAQIALEQGSVSALRGLGALLGEPGDETLRRTFAAWMRELVGQGRFTASASDLAGTLRELEEAGDLGEMGSLLAERIDEYIERAERRGEKRGEERGERRGEERGERRGEKRGEERGEKRGEERGLARERRLLSRLSARKFDEATAARLSAVLDGIDDPDRLAEIGEQVIDCATGAELLDRVSAAGR